ncbi:MAG: thioesterase family protein [Planctomycetota bacterium]|nr:thioesterase family protein [Planctomycetota bacterium]
MGPEDAIHETAVQVRYGEVDRMGIAHHRHYLTWFELGRTALLRDVGASYRDVEDAGTLLVVVETGVRHIRPAGYEDDLVVRTWLSEARGVRVRFDYEIRRSGVLLATGFTVLAACGPDGRPKRPPEDLVRLFEEAARKIAPSDDVQGAATP